VFEDSISKDNAFQNNLKDELFYGDFGVVPQAETKVLESMKTKKESLEFESDKWVADNNYKPMLEVDIKKSKFYFDEEYDFLKVTEAEKQVTIQLASANVKI
jgi:hypothetical protein